MKLRRLIISLFILSLSYIPAAANDFAADLQKFEARLVELSLSQSSQDRAAAISGLARIGSPKYEQVRNRLIADQDLVVQKA